MQLEQDFSFSVPLVLHSDCYQFLDNPIERAAHHFASINMMQSLYLNDCVLDDNSYEIKFGLSIEDDIKIEIKDIWNNRLTDYIGYDIFLNKFYKIMHEYSLHESNLTDNQILKFLFKHGYLN